MAKALLLSVAVLASSLIIAQQVELPIAPETGRSHTPEPFELLNIDDYRSSRAGASGGITTPPTGTLRTMAEWEEIETLVLAWTSYTGILKEIVRNAKDEVQVVIYAANTSTVTNKLNDNSGDGPLPDLNNISIVQGDFNSIWIRDFGAETVYRNDVDSLFLLDWIYNRNRPDDDSHAGLVSNFLGLDLYETTQAPYDLVHTGGNFMTDGFGTAFSSNLVLDENGSGGQFNVTVKNENMVDSIMKLYMGIDPDRYIKMDVLPYDAIHHIDMHMKLIDEETLLIGEFPTGLSDGPQLEANIQYILSNYNSVYGTPFKVVRIPMPTSTGGAYPPQAYYRTFTNSIFLNKTILVPTYREEYDTTAMRIYAEQLPGYNVVAIDCDNQGNNIIAASGALHCITKTIGVQDPLLITHQPLPDTNDDMNPYTVDAWLKHRTGIANAELYWSIDPVNGYTQVAMSYVSGNDWSASIPAQAQGTRVYYYVEGVANSGKTQVRPIVAPAGYWSFDIGTVTGVHDLSQSNFGEIYPNPASAITVVPFNLLKGGQLRIDVYDAMGRFVSNIYNGNAAAGLQNHFIDASVLAAGAYSVVATTEHGRSASKLVVK